MNTIIVLCLSIALVIALSFVVGAYVMTKRFAEAARRCSASAALLHKDKLEAHRRIAVLRDELERVKLEKAALEQEVATLRPISDRVQASLT